MVFLNKIIIWFKTYFNSSIRRVAASPVKKQFDSPVKKEGGVKLILRMKRHSPVLDDVLAKGRDAQQVR